VVVVVSVGLGIGCAGSGAGDRLPDPPGWQNGVRVRPVDEDEVREKIGLRADELRTCFSTERLSSPKLAHYVFELTIPPDGGPHGVEKLSATAEQPFLAECLHKVLAGIRFPAYAGEALRVKVPIEPAR
jgi:hypothetical protein